MWIFYTFWKYAVLSRVATWKALLGWFQQSEKGVVRLQAVFPQLLRKQRAAGRLLAWTQPWQVLLPPVELMGTSGKLILLVTGSPTALDSGCPLGITVPPPCACSGHGAEDGYPARIILS